MVKRNFAKEQSKLGIGTLDCNVPRDYIPRFVADFIDEVYPILNIKFQRSTCLKQCFRVLYSRFR